MKGAEFLDVLSDYKLLNKDPAPCSYSDSVNDRRDDNISRNRQVVCLLMLILEISLV
jgi:hypothetical protein